MNIIPYKKPSLPIPDRVQDLLSRMTLEEKVGQMMQLAWSDDAEDKLRMYHLGSFLHTLGEKTTRLQRIAVEESRLGIPLLFGIDAIHGHSLWPGATMFPTQLGMSCSWNIAAFERAARITALEMDPTGAHWTFSPVFCLPRDLRWGRVGETFGEDPLLIGIFGCAMVRGYQGKQLSDRGSVLACAKHFVGYGETHGGRDATEADLTPRKLKMYFLPPFERAAREGCATFMVAYHAIDGVPCSANRALLQDLLKHAWGFEGFTVTDWNNVGHLVNEQQVCADVTEASVAAIEAGNDMIMSTLGFFDAAVAAIRAGRVKESLVDDACRRMLRLKFELGLFEDPRYAAEAACATVVGCAEHRREALDIARQSVVLLKNDHLLPLDGKRLKRIAVVGPNADCPAAVLGDWSLGSNQLPDSRYPREKLVTVLDGIRAKIGDTAEVVYARGCNITDEDTGGIAEAVGAARDADVCVAVVGDTVEYWGEYKSTATLELMGGQQELLKALHATGTPLVVVLLNSKPLAVNWITENAPAVLEAWNPGSEGGHAVADVLFGDFNPCGKLTISFARHVGQQPVWYNQIPGQHGQGYADLTHEPLYPFGFGLSYTTYEYSDLKIEKPVLKIGESLRASVTVRNTGKRAGTEIVQLYVNDLVTSVTAPVKELKAFERINLAPGESKTVTFDIEGTALSLVDAHCKRVVEPGEFEVMVGPSSKDERLLKTRFRVA